MTQKELADLMPAWLKWDQSIVAKVETCRRRLDLVEFIEIAKALKLEPETLFARIIKWK